MQSSLGDEFRGECRRLGVRERDLNPSQRRAIIAAVSARQAADRVAPVKMTLRTISKMGPRRLASAGGAVAVAAARSLVAPLPLQQVEARAAACAGCDQNLAMRDGDVSCAACGCGAGFRFLKLRNRKAKCPHPKGSKWPR